MTDPTPLTDIERHSLVGSALKLSYFTIVWNGVVGASALVIGLTTGSLALPGFALNALLDSSASVVLVWRFRKERSTRSIADATADPGGLDRIYGPHRLSTYSPVRPTRTPTDERGAEEQPPEPQDGEPGMHE